VTKRSSSQRTQLQIEQWPQVDARALSAEDRAIFRQRQASVLAYARGARVKDAVREGVNRKTLARMMARALKPHPDGRLWGWRALVPREHVKVFERTAQPKVLLHTKAGNAGAFTQLLSRFPALETALRDELRLERVKLKPGATGYRLSGVSGAAERFRKHCRELRPDPG
jgi:hypothetical protein